MMISEETTEQLVDLLELIAAGSTAPTLASRAAGILPHIKTIPTGRQYVEGCEPCEYVRSVGGFGPRHDASPRCESGGHPHCTCDTCF